MPMIQPHMQHADKWNPLKTLHYTWDTLPSNVRQHAAWVDSRESDIAHSTPKEISPPLLSNMSSSCLQQQHQGCRLPKP